MLKELLEKRRSVRKYLSLPVEEEKLLLIADAFRLAPSAKNRQEWKLYAVSDPAVRAAIRQASPGMHSMLEEAPVILVATGKKTDNMTNSHRADTIDISIAMSYAVLQATELELGTCWMANYNEKDVRSALGLSDEISVVSISPLGYPAEMPALRPRKNLNEVWEKR